MRSKICRVAIYGDQVRNSDTLRLPSSDPFALSYKCLE